AAPAQPVSATEPRCRPAPVVIFVDDTLGGLGQQRDLAEPLAGANALVWTLRRLGACRLVDRVILASADVEATRRLVPDAQGSSAPRDGGGTQIPRDGGGTQIPRDGGGTQLRIEHVEIDRDLRARRRAIGAARRFSAACWRGGLAGL